MNEPSNSITQYKVSAASKLGIAFAAVAMAFTNAMPTFLSYFTTESLAIPIAQISLMMMLVKIFDAITDILAGIVIDKTKSPKGKARPWLLRGGVPMAICMAAIFFVPAELSTGTKLVLVAVLYALNVSIFGTLFGCARYAIIPRMSKDMGERGVLSSLNDGIMALVAGLAMALVMIMAYSPLGWKGTFSIFAAIALVGSVLGYAFVREMPREVIGEGEKSTVPIKDLLRSLFTNKYALLFLIIAMIQFVAQGMLQLGGSYYFAYILGDPTKMSLTMFISMVPAVIAMFVVPAIMKRTTRLFAYGCAIGAVLLLIVYFFGGAQNPWFVIIVMAFVTLFCTMIPPMCFGVLASMVVDYGEWHSGIRSDGLTSSVCNFANKVGQAIGIAILGAYMGAAGFIEGGGMQTAQALASIKAGYQLIPAIILAVDAIIFFALFNLGKKLPQVQAELAARHNQK